MAHGNKMYDKEYKGNKGMKMMDYKKMPMMKGRKAKSRKV